MRDQFARSPRLNRLLSPLLPAAVRLAGGLRVPIRWFCNMRGVANDVELAEMLARDPLGGGSWVSLRFLHSLLSIRPPFEPEAFDLCPVLFAHPAADRWTTLDASRPFFDRLAAPRELVMLENCGHLPIEEPGITQLEQATVAFLRRVVDTR